MKKKSITLAVWNYPIDKDGISINERGYKVIAAKNVLNPRVGDEINERGAKILIDRYNLDVIIKPQKD